MSDGAALLDLQELDLRLDQLRHRRATLPELAERESVESELAALRAAQGADDEAAGTLGAEQRRLEDEVAGIEAKVARERQRESTMTSPRELQAVEAEIESLGRRQTELEDRILELMEETEPLDAAREERAPKLVAVDERLTELGAAITAAQAALDGEIAEVVAGREPLAAAVGESSLRAYEQLREKVGGVVVGRLEGSTCTSCMLQLPPTEVEQLREAPAGSVHPCNGLLIVMV
ncbi:MAG: hypothetical protein AAFZ07_12280 [Actinomycetota bacterium]